MQNEIEESRKGIICSNCKRTGRLKLIPIEDKDQNGEKCCRDCKKDAMQKLLKAKRKKAKK